jgi:hypothetical protein
MRSPSRSNITFSYSFVCFFSLDDNKPAFSVQAHSGHNTIFLVYEVGDAALAFLPGTEGSTWLRLLPPKDLVSAQAMYLGFHTL